MCHDAASIENLVFSTECPRAFGVFLSAGGDAVLGLPRDGHGASPHVAGGDFPAHHSRKIAVLHFVCPKMPKVVGFLHKNSRRSTDSLNKKLESIAKNMTEHLTIGSFHGIIVANPKTSATHRVCEFF